MQRRNLNPESLTFQKLFFLNKDKAMNPNKVSSQPTDIATAIQKVEDALDKTKLITDRFYLSLINQQILVVDSVFEEDEQIKAQLEEAIKSLVEISEYSRNKR